MLLAAVILKFAPVMVTVVPTGPDAGLNDVMTGWANILAIIPKNSIAKRVDLYMPRLLFRRLRINYMSKIAFPVSFGNKFDRRVVFGNKCNVLGHNRAGNFSIGTRSFALQPTHLYSLFATNYYQ
jgi:hypothetical protein